VITPGVSLGYADTLHSTSVQFVPHPWLGDPGVVFLGCTAPSITCGLEYDAGVIRVDNPTGNPALTLTDAFVDIGPCHFTPWGSFVPGATAAAGERFVLTQTGLLGAPQPPPCDGRVTTDDRPHTNFDTSEGPLDTASPPFSNCDPNAVAAPVITLKFSNGMTLTITDTAKVLTTGGVDRFACTGAEEATPYTPVPSGDVVRVG